MRKINIICIGNLKEKYLKDASKEYEKRLSPYCSLSIVELSETKCSDKPSKAEISNIIESEGNLINARLKPNTAVISLCIEGKQFSSEDFSKKLSDIMSNDTYNELSFVIGGSFGLSDTVKNKSILKLSISEMTFTHQISRILLLEQMYRSFQIKIGGKYHK